MTTLFSDTFESNDFSAWTSTSISGTGSAVATNTTAAQAGTYGFQATKPNTSNNGNAQAVKDGITGSGGKIWLEFYLKIASISNDNVSGLIEIHNGSNNIVELYVITNASTFEVQFRKKDGSMTAGMAVGTLSTATWYKIGVWADYSLATPEFKVYLNDAQVGSTVTDASSGSVSTTTLQLKVGFIEWTWNGSATLYYDGVIMSDVESGAPPAAPRRLLSLLGVG